MTQRVDSTGSEPPKNAKAGVAMAMGTAAAPAADGYE